MPLPHVGFLLWILPICYALGGITALLPGAPDRGWRRALALSACGGAACAAVVVADLVRASRGGIIADPPGTVMAGLLALLGWAIVRYSRTYLRGEPGQARYLSALMLTLTAVGIVVLSHDLAAILLAWSSSSLALHRLLTFYPERPRALLAAHKKFIVSRLAELCIAGALALLYVAGHALSLEAVNALARDAGANGWMVGTAMVLIATAVVLKAAQLPFHGWLIQVMEAPTPVSALLHAGVVNIGGFILIRLAPLLHASFAAQALLVGTGTLTASIAGLAMMTRVDIKSRLAWSTCSQMGFMLLECGLGLLPLAFLHLVAHSFYKAYGFLSTGETVRRNARARLAPAAPSHGPGRELAGRLLAAPLAVGVAFGLAGAINALTGQAGAPAVALLIVGLACAPLFWNLSPASPLAPLRGLLIEAGLVLAYLLWHGIFYRLAAGTATRPEPALAAAVATVFCLMYVAQIAVQAASGARAIRRLHAWAYAGFYLDEGFDRLTQRIWPLRRTLQTTAALPFASTRKTAGDCE